MTQGAQTVFKQPLAVADSTFTVPYSARFLTVQIQNGSPCVWWQQDEDDTLPRRSVVLRAVGTGFVFAGEHATYLGTTVHDDREANAMWPNGFVWHWYVIETQALESERA